MDPTNPARPSWEDDTQPVPPPAEPPASTSPPPDQPTWGAAPPPAATPAPAWGAPGQPPGPGSAPAGGQPGPAVPPSGATANQGMLVLGILLVLLGSIFLITRFVDFEIGGETWPLWIVAVGAAMLIASLAIRSSAGLGLAIPGGIVTMVGLVLTVQQAYDLYATWAYAWALVAPGGVGLGMLVHGTFTGDHETRNNGFQTMLVGLGLFVGFGLFFEGVLGLSGVAIPGLEDALPVIVIALGAVMVVAALIGPGRKKA